MLQNPQDNKPLDIAMLDFFNWVNANTFGKVRQIKDAFEYSIGWTGSPASFHAQADALKNVTTSNISVALAMTNSTTNMLLNYDLLMAGNFEMLSCYKEWKLGTAITTNTVANVGNPVTAQTITFSGLSTSTYYVVYIPTNKASAVTMANGSFVNNSAIAAAGGFPAGFTGLMFLPSSAAPVITLTAALGVGLATGTNTQLKLYPVSSWSAHECKVWICSNEV
jgi:hypothetical protein